MRMIKITSRERTYEAIQSIWQFFLIVWPSGLMYNTLNLFSEGIHLQSLLDCRASLVYSRFSSFCHFHFETGIGRLIPWACFLSWTSSPPIQHSVDLTTERTALLEIKESIYWNTNQARYIHNTFSSCNNLYLYHVSRVSTRQTLSIPSLLCHL